MSEPSELKACPFCGGEAKQRSSFAAHYVECQSCGVSIGTTAENWDYQQTKNATAWNTRPTQPVVERVVGAEALDMIQLPIDEPSQEFIDRLHAFLAGAEWESERNQSIAITCVDQPLLVEPGDWVVKGDRGGYSIHRSAPIKNCSNVLNYSFTSEELIEAYRSTEHGTRHLWGFPSGFHASLHAVARMAAHKVIGKLNDDALVASGSTIAHSDLANDGENPLHRHPSNERASPPTPAAVEQQGELTDDARDELRIAFKNLTDAWEDWTAEKIPAARYHAIKDDFADICRRHMPSILAVIALDREHRPKVADGGELNTAVAKFLRAALTDVNDGKWIVTDDAMDELEAALRKSNLAASRANRPAPGEAVNRRDVMKECVKLCYAIAEGMRTEARKCAEGHPLRAKFNAIATGSEGCATRIRCMIDASPIEPTEGMVK